MNTDSFDYSLPKDFIAQNPVEPRDSCKLMLYDSDKGEVEHKRFFELVDLLKAGDVLVLNRSKVIPARILFEVNGVEKEIFLLKKINSTDYKVLLKPARFFGIGKEIGVSGDVSAKVLVVNDDGTRVIRFFAENTVNLDLALLELGKTPLPPYIQQSKATFSEYQTVYAKEEGSCAAPTAGLHFTEELLASLRQKGVQIAEIILHVGLGTFLPVKVYKIEDHKMHSEEFILTDETADLLNAAKKERRRIVAVGTTSVRVLESCFKDDYGFVAVSGETDIFIYPSSNKLLGHQWKAVDALITNYHLPKSTLLMLVASFLENRGISKPVEKLFELYELAMKNDYRFYSFGDAMMIV